MQKQTNPSKKVSASGSTKKVEGVFIDEKGRAVAGTAILKLKGDEGALTSIALTNGLVYRLAGRHQLGADGREAHPANHGRGADARGPGQRRGGGQARVSRARYPAPAKATARTRTAGPGSAPRREKARPRSAGPSQGAKRASRQSGGSTPEEKRAGRENVSHACCQNLSNKPASVLGTHLYHSQRQGQPVVEVRITMGSERPQSVASIQAHGNGCAVRLPLGGRGLGVPVDKAQEGNSLQRKVRGCRTKKRPQAQAGAAAQPSVVAAKTRGTRRAKDGLILSRSYDPERDIGGSPPRCLPGDLRGHPAQH